MNKKYKNIDDLRDFHDRQFIHLAYRTILKRDPDPTSLDNYLNSIRKSISHAEILQELKESDEAQTRFTSISKHKKTVNESDLVRNNDSKLYVYTDINSLAANKPLIIIDLYVLGQGVKTGVYRVCDEIFKRLIKVSDFNFAYYVDRCFPTKSLEYLKENEIFISKDPVSLDRLVTEKDSDSFFISPFGVAPEQFRKSKTIRHVHIVYDLIAIRHPEYFTHEGATEVKSIIQSLTEETIILAISDYTKKDLLEYRPDLKSEQVTVFPLAANSKFHPISDKPLIDKALKKYNIPTAPYFLSVATIEIRKNFEGVLEAFFRYIENNPNANANLVITGGNGWKTEKVESTLSAHPNHNSRVVFTGYVDDDDLPVIYSQAIAFIYLSRYEGFGLPPLEAMACGVPVITSDNSSLPEVIGKAGLMADCDDVDTVALHMKILANKEIRQEFAQRSLTRSSHFTWEKSTAVIVDRLNKELRRTKKSSTRIWPQWRDKLPTKDHGLLAEGGLRCSGFLKAGSKDKLLISYVTVVRNNPVTLARTIESVQSQTYSNVEHIILDGASNDSTLSVIEKYSNKIDYYASEADGGLYDAINKAIELCRGDLICVLNSDDWLPVNAAEIVASKYSGGLCELVIGAAAVDVGSGKINVWQPDNVSLRSYFAVANCCHNAIYATREAYKKSGKYNLRYTIAADFEWIMKCFESGCIFNYCEDILVNYSLGGVSGDSGKHVFESKQIAAKRFKYLDEEEVSQLNYIFYPWREILEHDKYSKIKTEEVFSHLRQKYSSKSELVGIINTCEGKTIKIAYVDHSYHQKTISTNFLSRLLTEYGHQVDFYWDESWIGGSSVSFSEVMNYDAVIMFQSYCDLEPGQCFSQLHSNVTYIPMLDQFGIWRGPRFNLTDFWAKFQGSKVINFSSAVHALTVGHGISSRFFRFYRPTKSTYNRISGLHGFLWIRRQDEVSWQLVKKLIGETKFDSFHIHLAPDPGTQEIILPDDFDIKRHGITFSKWFDNKEDFELLLSKSNVLFAPRMEEGIGQFFLEGFARGQCIVAPNNGTMNEYIQNNFTGYLYDWENPLPLDFSRLPDILSRVREANESGYSDWVNSFSKIVDYIVMPNKSAY